MKGKPVRRMDPNVVQLALLPDVRNCGCRYEVKVVGGEKTSVLVLPCAQHGAKKVGDQ